MISFNIGGVPEHFNMPWHLLFQSGRLQADNIQASWTDYPGGTGDMVRALNEGALDVAIVLTEGAIKGIDQGGDFKLLNFFVDSPLIWGIHVPAESSFQTMEAVKGGRYAISRYGSGSHLISYVDAKNRNWPVEKLDFVEVGGLDGAREAFRAKTADIFLWEKFTTKPYVDNGEFRLLDECNPGFSSFVIAVSTRTWADHQESIKTLINQVLETSRQLQNNPDKAQIIASHYGLHQADIEAWLKTTRWTADKDIAQEKLEIALDILKELNLIRPTLTYSDLIFDGTKS